MLSWSEGTFLDRKVPFPMFLRTRYLNLLQDVKVIIIVNKIKSCLGASEEAAFYKFLLLC